MSLSEFADLTGSIESIATIVALVIGGIWAVRLYRNQRENVPWIEFNADINVIGKHPSGDWIVELIAHIENKGKVRHQLSGPDFELAALSIGDPLVKNADYNGQTNFPHEILRGTWLPKKWKYFFVEPGVHSTYSYITHVPSTLGFLMLHANFSYPGGREGHSAERTIALGSDAIPSRDKSD